MLDALKVTNFYTGNTDEAIRYGQRALDLRDQEPRRNPPPLPWTEPAGPPLGNNVISFAMGAGAVLRLRRHDQTGAEPHRLPRLDLHYIDAAVSPPCAAFLRDNGADVRNIDDEYPGVGLFQRFWS